MGKKTNEIGFLVDSGFIRMIRLLADLTACPVPPGVVVFSIGRCGGR
jgi:hypothetical protein